MEPREGEMIRADLVITGASEVLVCPAYPGPDETVPGLGRIPEGALAISGGHIVWVGPSSRLQEEVRVVPGGERVDAAGRIVMPGLIDPHTHLAFEGERADEYQLRLAGSSYQDIAIFGGGIMKTVYATREADRETLMASARRRLDRFLHHGITTVDAKSGYGLTPEHELRLLEIYRELDGEHPVDVVPTLLAANTVPIEYVGRPDDYVDLIIKKMIPAAAKHGLATFCDAFYEQGGFDAAQARRVLEAGLEHGLLAKLHADQLTPGGGAELAVELGAVSADHLDLVSEEGIAAMAAASAEDRRNVADTGGVRAAGGRRAPVAVLLPGATFFLGEGGLAPARALLDAGVRVALGTDFNPGSSPTQNLWLIATMGGSMLGMSAEEVIRAITIEAAAAVGRDHEVGSLEVGKRADFLVLEYRNYVEIPYRYGMNPVWMVYKNGRCVVQREHVDERL